MYTDSHLSQSAKRIGLCPISAQQLNYYYRHQNLWTHEESSLSPTGKLNFNEPNFSPLGKGHVKGQLNKVGAHLVLVLETPTEQQDIGTGSLFRYPC